MDNDGVKALIIFPEARGGLLPEEPQLRRRAAEGLIREYAEQALLCGVDFRYHRHALVPRPALQQAARDLRREHPDLSHAFYLDQGLAQALPRMRDQACDQEPHHDPAQGPERAFESGSLAVGTTIAQALDPDADSNAAEDDEVVNSMRDFAWELWHQDLPALPLGLSPQALAAAGNKSVERERAPLETLSSLPVTMYAADPERHPGYANWLARNRELLCRFPVRDRGGIPCGDEAFISAASRFFRRQGFRIDTVLAGRSPQNHAMFVLHSDTYTNGERVVLLCRRNARHQRPWAGVVRRIIGFVPQVAANFRRIMFAPEFSGETECSGGRLASHIVSREYFEELMYLLN